MKNYDEYVNFTDRYGNKVRKHIRAKNLAEFQQKVKKIEQELNHSPAISKVTDEWYEFKKEQITESSILSYKASIQNIKDYFGNKYIDEIHPSDVSKFLDKLCTEYMLSKSSINMRMTVLKQIFDYAIVNDMIQYNPCFSVRVPNSASKKKRLPPSSEDVETIKKNVKSAPFGLFPFLLLYTGCRRGEALALRYEDIDYEKKVIAINKQYIFINNKPILENHTKTSSGMRTVPLLPPLEKALPKKKRGLIFSNNGEPFSLMQYRTKLQAYEDATGTDFTAHQLRHQYATILYEAGIQVKDAQALLGHSKASITQDIYQHISENQQQKTFQNLIDYVSEPAPKLHQA